MSFHQRNPDIYVAFDTGEKFPVRYYQTSDLYSVDLPAGTYEGEYLRDLKRNLQRDFNGVRIVK